MSRRNAPENFFFRGTGLPTAVRKNQPLVPRSNLGGTVCARTNPWFRGQTLLVLGHGGGGYVYVYVYVYVSVCYAGVTAGLPKAAAELLALFLLTQKGA